MDSGAKSFFRKLKRIQFWIICPLVILIGMISWWLAIGSIQKERDRNKAKIDGFYSTLQNVEREDRHANDKVSEGMEVLIARRRNEVAEAWTERWNQQTAKADIFKWPEVLGERFISKVKHLRPIETTVGFPPEQDLVISQRRQYRDYIKDELPKLAEQIGAEWNPDSSGRGGRSEAGMYREEGRPRREGGGPQFGTAGQPAAKAFDQSLVEWDPANQSEIETTHFDWSVAPPSLLDILYAHEDLTVLRSIMNVINKANEGAATRFNAAVKEIEFIRIGKNAAGSAGQVFSLGSAGVGPGSMRMREGGMPGMGMEGRYEGGGYEGRPPEGGRMEGRPPEGGRMEGRPPEGGRMEGGRMEGGMMGYQQGPGLDPADGRYVDKNYLALPASTLRSVLKKPTPGEPSEPIDPESAYLAVAKRIPVRMRLRVDQRKLNKLLAECANSELTIEIRQVRINPDKEIATGAAMRPTVRPREGMPQRTDSSSSSEELFQYDIDVELYGIVYVYNPVNKEVLGIEEESTEENTEEGVPVAAN